MNQVLKQLTLALVIAMALSSCSTPADPTPTPTLSPTSTRTPTPTLSTGKWFSENVEISMFELFNAGEDVGSRRDYSDTFAQGEARVIYGEFDFDHPGLSSSKTMTMQASYFGPDGKMFGRVEIEPKIDEGSESSNWVLGFGWDELGNWGAGEYLVEVRIDNQMIASKTFNIVAASPTPTFTATPKALALVDTRSLNIRQGPGTAYGTSANASEGDELEVIGQAYDCEWLKVTTSKGEEGWVSKSLVEYDIPCSQIPAAKIPPTPIPPKPSATTKVETPKQPAKQEPKGPTVNVQIQNNTGGTVTLSLSGPATYRFSIGPGNQKISVIKGTYSFTAWGCGGASDSGTKVLKGGLQWTWYCN